MQVAARDGIEPPPAAFSGPPSKRTKWSGISFAGGSRNYFRIVRNPPVAPEPPL